MENRFTLFAATLALVATGIAGCLSSGQTDPALPTLDELLAGQLVDDEAHDHAAIAGHNQSFNMEVLGYASGLTTPAIYGELDVRSDVVAVALLQQAGEQRPGFVLFDAKDPAKLTKLGEGFAPTATVYAADLKLSDDANYLFLASQPSGSLPFALAAENGVPVPTLPLSAPLSLANNGYDAGVVIFDIHNKAEPKIIGFFPVQRSGVHMMDVHDVNGQTYLFLQATTGLPIPTCAKLPDQLPVDECAAGPYLPAIKNDVIIASFKINEAGFADVREVQRFQGVEGHYIHDMTVVDDPVEEKPLMYVAHWNDGVHVVDLSNLPGGVTTLGKWASEEFTKVETEQGHVHTVMANVIGDRRIVVGSPEFGFRSSAPPVYIVDATDFDNVSEIGRWTVPNGANLNFSRPHDAAIPAPLYRWSTHNINMEDGLLYLSHFHGGVWVLDFRTDPAHPTVVGQTMLAPQARGIGAIGGALNDSPSVWDAFPYKGTVFITDINGGLYTARLVDVPEPPATEESTPEGAHHG